MAKMIFYGFNPRPVYKPGDTYPDPKMQGAIIVSIHARFISRAIRLAAAHQRQIDDVSIHARFISRAIHALRSVESMLIVVSIHARFISRAIQEPDPGTRAMPCFNPRPVYKPGDTQPADHPQRLRQVSIHARFISRAIPTYHHDIIQGTDVSIHARFISRAIRAYLLLCLGG